MDHFLLTPIGRVWRRRGEYSFEEGMTMTKVVKRERKEEDRRIRGKTVKENRTSRMKSGESNCFNGRNLDATLKKFAYDVPSVVAAIHAAFEVNHRRISAVVIEWLRQKADTCVQAQELLLLIES